MSEYLKPGSRVMDLQIVGTVESGFDSTDSESDPPTTQPSPPTDALMAFKESFRGHHGDSSGRIISTQDSSTTVEAIMGDAGDSMIHPHNHNNNTQTTATQLTQRVYHSNNDKFNSNGTSSTTTHMCTPQKKRECKTKFQEGQINQVHSDNFQRLVQAVIQAEQAILMIQQEESTYTATTTSNSHCSSVSSPSTPSTPSATTATSTTSTTTTPSPNCEKDGTPDTNSKSTPTTQTPSKRRQPKRQTTKQTPYFTLPKKKKRRVNTIQKRRSKITKEFIRHHAKDLGLALTLFQRGVGYPSTVLEEEEDDIVVTDSDNAVDADAMTTKEEEEEDDQHETKKKTSRSTKPQAYLVVDPTIRKQYIDEMYSQLVVGPSTTKDISLSSTSIEDKDSSSQLPTNPKPSVVTTTPDETTTTPTTTAPTSTIITTTPITNTTTTLYDHTNNEHVTSLFRRAEKALDYWKNSLRVNDTLYASDELVDYDCEDDVVQWTKLYSAVVLEVKVANAPAVDVSAGADCTTPNTISLGNCNTDTKREYTLQPNEKAILVHYVDYPKQYDRWHVIPTKDSTSQSTIASIDITTNANTDDSNDTLDNTISTKSILCPHDLKECTDALSYAKREGMFSLTPMPLTPPPSPDRSERITTAANNSSNNRRNNKMGMTGGKKRTNDAAVKDVAIVNEELSEVTIDSKENIRGSENGNGDTFHENDNRGERKKVKVENVDEKLILAEKVLNRVNQGVEDQSNNDLIMTEDADTNMEIEHEANESLNPLPTTTTTTTTTAPADDTSKASTLPTKNKSYTSSTKRTKTTKRQRRVSNQSTKRTVKKKDSKNAKTTDKDGCNSDDEDESNVAKTSLKKSNQSNESSDHRIKTLKVIINVFGERMSPIVATIPPKRTRVTKPLKRANKHPKKMKSGARGREKETKKRSAKRSPSDSRKTNKKSSKIETDTIVKVNASTKRRTNITDSKSTVTDPSTSTTNNIQDPKPSIANSNKKQKVKERGKKNMVKKDNSDIAPADDTSATKTKEISSNKPKSSTNNGESSTKPKDAIIEVKETHINKGDDTMNTWICAACREADCLMDKDAPLIICDGDCHRAFHIPCVGLNSIPPEDEEWICPDCTAGRHQCGICHEFGSDDVDVFKCKKSNCGLFYHEACLAMHDVDVEIVTTYEKVDDNHAFQEGEREQIIMKDGERVIAKNRPNFICPAHECWTCSGGVPPDPVSPENVSPSDVRCKIVPSTDTNSKKKKKGKGRRSVSEPLATSFRAKSETLFRCLECPVSFHLSCISPLCNFHELALLCPQHAKTSKLPYLDKDASIQGQLEAAEADKGKQKKGKKKNDQEEEDLFEGINNFLPGVSTNFTLSHQEEMIELSADGAMDQMDDDEERGDELDFMRFCLPCDIREEVYAKPPSYSHIHSNRYDPQNKPKRQPPSGDVCECVPITVTSDDNDEVVPTIFCGENCMNRMFGIECVGDATKKNGEKNPYWNCNCGPNCGNRRLTKRQHAKCKPQREQGKGWGVVAVNAIEPGDLVQEYVGEIIHEAEKRKRLDQWSIDHPNDPNFYIMHLETGWYIDAREKGNLSRFINHSCDPNCKIIPINVAGHTRMAIFATQKIYPGQFLNYDYNFDTKHGDKFRCRCGSKNCRGTMKGGKTNTSNDAAEEKKKVKRKKTKKQMLAEGKARLDADKKHLEDVMKSQLARFSQVGVWLPGEKDNGNNTTVASGPKESWRKDVIGTGVCLWRNVTKGYNFHSRNIKLGKEHQDMKAQSFIRRRKIKWGKVDVLGQVFYSS